MVAPSVAEHQAGLLVAGLDEAGRGALAGPVVAGACILTETLFRKRLPFSCWSPFRRRKEEDCIIADSKQLSPEEREIAFAWIAAHCPYGTGIVSYEIIERKGILRATERAMQEAVENLRRRISSFSLLVDGYDSFSFDCPHRSIIRGDATESCIAAASIVAKVTRDRLMLSLDRAFPLYRFAEHKGYGTPQHIALIRKHGPCTLHRLSFLTKIL